MKKIKKEILNYKKKILMIQKKKIKKNAVNLQYINRNNKDLY